MLEIVRAACEAFDDDPSSPSLIVSWLAKQQMWYFSFVRYREAYGREKYKVCGTVNADFSKGMEELLGRMKPVIEEQMRGRNPSL